MKFFLALAAAAVFQESLDTEKHRNQLDLHFLSGIIPHSKTSPMKTGHLTQYKRVK